ncbi:MAG: hypothetical protein KAR35_08435 [Candidatus Heimdallarchaeota archaeon]|nr:hypothetical protein [Candidatus Heimdallarchaeota archaeon]MCK5049384.1 hypothetical protein [Candidatus Heimdallarchaeota archaeon]
MNEEAPQTKERVICDKCGTILHEKIDGHKSLTDIEEKYVSVARGRKFKWYVTPANLLLTCLFIAGIDYVTEPNEAKFNLDWAVWPIIGIIFLFLAAALLSKRPESFWVMGPLIFIELIIFLYAMDIAYGSNDGIFGLDWSQIPILFLLIFGFAIPLVSKLGFETPTIDEKFDRMVGDE